MLRNERRSAQLTLQVGCQTRLLARDQFISLFLGPKAFAYPSRALALTLSPCVAAATATMAEHMCLQ